MSLPADIKASIDGRKGGRPANHAVLLTQAEFDWCLKTIQKRAQLAASLKGQPKLRAIIAALDEKLTLAQTQLSTKLDSNRQELQILRDIVENTITGLKQKVLPSYQTKVAKDPATYGPRMAEAGLTLAMLVTLVNKIEKVFNAGTNRRNSQF